MDLIYLKVHASKQFFKIIKLVYKSFFLSEKYLDTVMSFRLYQCE